MQPGQHPAPDHEHRHAGHADLVRELIDGEVGLRAGGTNIPHGDQAWWQSYRARLQSLAEKTRSS